MPKALRFAVLERDGFRCRYCGTTGEATTLHVDHVHPRAKGGTNALTNLVTACPACNLGKSDRVLRPAGPREAPSRHASPPVAPPAPAISAPTPSGDLLEGLYFHALRDGLADWQGRIVRADDTTIIGQLYSWIDGSPTELQAFPRADVGAWRLYPTHAAWVSAGDRLGEQMYRAHQERRAADRPDIAAA